MSSHYRATSGVDIFTLLGLVFIHLQLSGNINWPWFWIVAPFWMPFFLKGMVEGAIEYFAKEKPS